MWLLMSPVWKILKGCVFSVTILNIYPVDIAPPPQGSFPPRPGEGIGCVDLQRRWTHRFNLKVLLGLAILLQVCWGNQHFLSSSGGGADALNFKPHQKGIMFRKSCHMEKKGVEVLSHIWMQIVVMIISIEMSYCWFQRFWFQLL